MGSKSGIEPELTALQTTGITLCHPVTGALYMKNTLRFIVY